MSTNKLPEVIQNVVDEMHFDAKAVFVSGDFEQPGLLVNILSEQPGLGTYEDDVGNIQASVRLEHDPDVQDGMWVIVPTKTAQSSIDAAVAAYPAKFQAWEEENANPVIPPTVYDLFNDAANAVQAATSLDDIKAAFAQLQTDIQPFVTPPAQAEPAKATSKKK